MAPSRLVTPQEVADRLGLKVPTIYKMLRTGQLPSVKPTRRSVRMREEDLEAVIRFGLQPIGNRAYTVGGTR